MLPSLPSLLLQRVSPLLLALLLAYAVAQPSWAQTASQQRSKAYYLDVSAQPLSVPGRTVYVEQVLDGRVGHPAIGLIYRGIYDQRAPVIFRQSLETELTTWLQQQLPRQPNDHAVVLCIRQLQVSEVVEWRTAQAVSTADVVADVYAHLPDGYHFVRTVADNIDQAGINKNKDHAFHTALVLQNCLRQLAGIDWALVAQWPVRTLAQLPTDKPPVANKPAIFRVAAPRAGVYHTFDQFLANRPDTLTSLRIDTLGTSSISSLLNGNMPKGPESEWKSTTLLKAKARTASGDRLPPSEVWGFSDGRQVYVRQLNYYRPLTRQSDFYTFVGAAPLDVTAENERIRNNAMSNLTGVPVRTGATTNGAVRTGPAGQTGQPLVYSLDVRTGRMAPFPPPGQPQRLDTAFIYVYRPLGGPAEPSRILLNDREVSQLKPGESVELAWPYFGRAMRLSVGTASGPALLLAPSVSTSNYIKLVSDSARSPWQLVPPRQGEAEMDALEKRGQ
ncbi:hypothetical protein Q3A66_18590 [Hymenobacter sp. BT770]|uniref:hypothetical protein n=1 Tax=Hymenobacter sp. BT770 TaxID=2886942 RepID=UPI001D1274DD|nr:hypothetical protein [Hymenobacter sp. BT770]MCC3151971.1 hypothetical protein [Hymenobacter sp. BT770]MDO3417081.1 hypothetical protein [Hymenobacter sp. BT770]